MIIDDKILDILKIYIKIHNIEFLRYISINEKWDYKELIKIIND